MSEVMGLKSSRRWDHFPPKALVFLIVITIFSCFVYLGVTSDEYVYRLGSHSRQDISNQLRLSKISKSNGKRSTTTGYFGKIIIAFGYWEQLSMATNNLLHLAAFAAHGGRQVVVPFVKDSIFSGTAARNGFKTLALYFNVTALNDTLRSRGHATFISWEGFQDVCKGRLDVLVDFDYTDLNKSTTYSLATPFVPCMKDRQGNKFQGFEVGTRICMNAFALDSVDKFEREVVKRRPCVGISQWRGCNNEWNGGNRAKFDLSSIVENVMAYYDIGGFFNSKLIHIAQEFIAHNLGPHFISVHIRAEHILTSGSKLSLIKLCISKLSAQVQSIVHASMVPITVFVAADFNEFGSSSRSIKQARENAKSLMEILHPLKPITFQPAEYKLVDRGAVAIVEMNILASGKHLVLLGTGSFQAWVKGQFLSRNSNDQSRLERVPCQEM